MLNCEVVTVVDVASLGVVTLPRIVVRKNQGFVDS